MVSLTTACARNSPSKRHIEAIQSELHPPTFPESDDRHMTAVDACRLVDAGVVEEIVGKAVAERDKTHDSSTRAESGCVWVRQAHFPNGHDVIYVRLHLQVEVWKSHGLMGTGITQALATNEMLKPTGSDSRIPGIPGDSLLNLDDDSLDMKFRKANVVAHVYCFASYAGPCKGSKLEATASLLANHILDRL
jgi:hypothetical protein